MLYVSKNDVPSMIYSELWMQPDMLGATHALVIATEELDGQIHEYVDG